MTKYELYTSFVDMQIKSGQGTPRWVVEKLDSMDELNELIDEKMVTVTHIPSKTGMMPDEYWIVPTGCYNLWNENNPMLSLTFVRKFLNIPEEGIFSEMKVDEDMYNKWLNDNNVDLGNILTLDNNYMSSYYKIHNTLPLTNSSMLDQEQLDYISEFKFNTARKAGVVDLKVEHLKELLMDRIPVNNQLIDQYEKIIRLISDDQKAEYQVPLDKCLYENEMEKAILKKIKNLDSNKLLSEINNC